MLRIYRNNQKGLASIFISMIMMIVISLLVLGFVQFANKEAGQVLNRQLSTAAFYVAESGVNEVKSAYQYQKTSISTKNSCQNSSSGKYLQEINNSSNVSISCLLVNTQTTHLYDSNLPLGSSWITPINGTSTVNYLTIGWQNPNIVIGSTGFNYCFGNANQNPTYNLGSNIGINNQTGKTVYPDCDAGIIKVDLVPANSLNTAYVYYFYPQPVGQYGQSSNPAITNIIDYNQYSEGIPLPGNCPGPNNLSTEYCNVTINLTGLNEADYYIRIKTFYLPANLEISAENSDPVANPKSYQSIGFQGDQIVVDSTGKVNNVLQRIRVNLAPNYNTSEGYSPNSALSITQGICKQFYFTNGIVINSNNFIGDFGCKTF